MVITELTGKKVFLDTAPLIYFIEGHTVYQPLLANIFSLNDQKAFTFITSYITLLEVLVKPLQSGHHQLVNQYRHILTTAPGMELYEIDKNIAMLAARLRADFNLRTPDALQIATAIENKADYFLTNDNRLKSVTGITFITLANM